MKQISRILGTLFALLMFVACDTEMEKPDAQIPGADGYITCKMHLQGSVNEYGTATRGSESYSWANGDKIYIRFYDGVSWITGYAIYSSSSKDWNVSYSSPLKRDADTSCRVYFFTGVTHTSNTQVQLSATSGIYEALDATYNLSNGELNIDAQLEPKCGRIRFSSTQKCDFVNVAGANCYTSFNLLENKYTTASSTVGLSFTGSGTDYKSEYLYGCDDGKSFKMSVVSDIHIENEYTRGFSNNVFAAGNSGVLSLPTEALNKGWSVSNMMNNYLTASYVDMGLSVDWATAPMQNTYQWGALTPTGSYASTTSTIAGNPNYDVATIDLGAEWRIPTWSQVQELNSNSYIYKKDFTDLGLGKGLLFVSKKNFNFLFIKYSDCYFWTADSYSSYSAYFFKINSSYSYAYTDWNPKYYDYYILPVRVK